MEQDTYLSVAKPIIVEIEIKKSRFICMCTPAAYEQEALDYIKKAHVQFPDATHHCYAYSVGYPKLVTHQDDDGEPHQTAGRPILRVIEGQKLVNTVIVVVRYFGGILLGAGGLTRAYANAARAGVEKSGIVTYASFQSVKFDCDYSSFGRVEYTLKASNLRFETLEFGRRIAIMVYLPVSQLDMYKSLLNDLLKADTHLEELHTVYLPVSG
jgi:uncharacterized YigZ family protein